jgi:NADPH:quinone reductase-like Zn-dependent oxidoreductase
MKAAVVNSFASAPQFQDFAEPVAAEGEIVVEMLAVGLHPVVKSLASGKHYSSNAQPPLIPGVDGVARLEDGSIHYCYAAHPPYGTLAQRTLITRGSSIPLPSGLDPAYAAAIANPGMSAWLSLNLRGGLSAGETVLVNGATGVAGQLAVQAARYQGASRVIATGRNADALAGLGADATILLTEPEDAVRQAFTDQVQGGGIDLIIDYLWGRPTELLLEAMGTAFRSVGEKRVRLVEVGESAGRTIALPGAILRGIDLTLCGSGFGSARMSEILDAIPTLFNLAAEGHLKVAVEMVPLEQVEEAWSRVEKGKRIVFSI